MSLNELSPLRVARRQRLLQLRLLRCQRNNRVADLKSLRLCIMGVYASGRAAMVLMLRLLRLWPLCLRLCLLWSLLLLRLLPLQIQGLLPSSGSGGSGSSCTLICCCATRQM